MSAITLATAAGLAAGTTTYAAPATPAQHFEQLVGAVFFLNVTAAGVGAGDTLDVYVQHSLDDGVNYDDFVHFTQALGNGGAKKFKAVWLLYGGTPTVALGPLLDGTMAAGVNQGPVGPMWRTKVIAVGGTAAFTFTLSVSQNDPD
jgi:hypothetical protein